ncbi:ead/Ea22-like family protein [Salmonella enterica]|uniref:Ead/Ea22-like family protein n=1 Tax=Salmonella enterica TaxID=28901 RepID=A0A5Z4XWS3_SALER|nr:ead/Ea22-like family protein [Salmonella enterica]EBP3971120.1 ead/Ea22-like family protein [Salmonella enterica subsp. enterica]EDO4940381.1 ead/Ea22-like family protein [Salmonella enterica subsp. enterica serovar 4,[5],12:b:-]EDQ6356371.1 ead/Ea22-like family protein [Salmonella enterica subsp. enterica serovar Java]EHB1107052.1 ead/Ea22-like family protein [Salmonella enterica subsp. enterica serovar Typhimurium]EHF2402809.1 ead/Ea22-like family protein [Salmonella enterica subsp. enter
MSNIDKQALREAAEEALPAMQRLLMMPNDELFDEALLNVDGDVDAANAFNLLSGPETMLALLDENIQLQREKDAIEAVALALRDDMRQAREQLEESEKRNVELESKNGYLRTIAHEQNELAIRASLDSNNATVEMGRLHKRIAELEAREVNLSKLSVGEVMHMSGFSRDYADGWCAGNDNAIHEIRTAGIKVKES